MGSIYADIDELKREIKKLCAVEHQLEKLSSRLKTQQRYLDRAASEMDDLESNICEIKDLIIETENLRCGLEQVVRTYEKTEQMVKDKMDGLPAQGRKSGFGNVGHIIRRSEPDISMVFSKKVLKPESWLLKLIIREEDGSGEV